MAEPATTEPRPPAPVGAGELGERLGIELVSAEPHRVVGTLPVRGNTQPFGVLHGGASCVLAESLASIGACLHFGADGGVGVGTEISASHHRPVSGGRVTGVATAVRLGRTHATYEIAVEDEQGRRVCSARMTCVRARASRDRGDDRP
ncbi:MULTISPECIES: PaaI family thioesterase [Streptomyces]|uniref:PaaI family thioesterase n=1 Tax=Streptomyces TaxID=1883 RepID=UPI0022498E37|nr:hotdog fold thioesterase [Streptomyces sp. JHD 1]MCX2971402.1 hotdog fold thioesterase [Streptomyces sp. JHD 1]